MDKLLDRRNTVILVAALTLWRLYLSAQLDLHPDEAYYWLWSRHLAISYFDHPPMVAYFIWLTTLVSQHELWVRLSGTGVALILSGVIWRLSMQLFQRVEIAAGSVMLFNVCPLNLLGLMVITPDVPLLLFWSVGIYLAWQTGRSDKAWPWLALGLAFGMALLSKYTAVLMLPSLGLYLWLSDDRHWLKTIYPYLATLVGIACFLPVVYWNSRHDWASFGFQFRNGLGGTGVLWANVAEYLAGQMLVVGPLVWMLGVGAALAGFHRRDKATLLLICASLPTVLFFAITSLRKVAGPNWPAFAYVTFSMLVTQYCLADNSRIRRTLWSIAALMSLALSAVATLHARFDLIPLDRHSQALAAADATNAFQGWRSLGAGLARHPERKFVVTPSHQLSSEIMYYSHESVLAQTAKGTRPTQFNFWDWPRGGSGSDPLYIWTESDNVAPYSDSFAATSGASVLDAYRGPRAIRRYYIISGAENQAPPFVSN